MNKSYLPISIFLLFAAYILAQAPTGFTGTGYRTTAYLQWDTYTAFEPVGYNIYRSATSGNYGAPVRRVGAYNDYTDYNLTEAQTYYYRIAAFDATGNESTLSTEITVSTNQKDYQKVASLDLLIPIYNGGMSATAPDEIKQGLEFARRLFFRNSFGQLNLKFHYMIIDGYPPLNADGVANFNTIGADLSARGILDNQYDAIHIEALKLYGWYGGAQWLGQTAGSMAYNWTGFDPMDHYARGDAWVFTHEFGHSLDLIIAKQSGYPEMIFNHFPWAHPMPPEIGVFDAGENFDAMALVLRLFEHHLEYKAPWDGYIEVIDIDDDGLADEDARLPFDESRFGSNPNLEDSDGDGLNDLEEFTADVYEGSDPNHSDTDADGTVDGIDPYPVSNFSNTVEKTVHPMQIDGMLTASEDWQPMASGTYFSKLPGATLQTFTAWDDDFLYYAFQSNQQLKYYLKIDASGEDGIFASTVKWPGGDYGSINEKAWGNAYFDQASLIIRTNETQVYKKDGFVPGSSVKTVFQNGTYTTEVKLPHHLGPGFGYSYVYPDAPEITELSFSKNDVLGVQVLAQPLSGSVAYEWDDWRTGQWLSLAQPFHYYDMTLKDGGTSGDYCIPASDFPWEDWIAHVAVGTIDNASGKSPYSDFTTLSTPLTASSSHPIALSAGFSYFTWDEYWRIWIDFNQNGNFTDAGEMVFSGIKNKPPDGTPSATLNGTLNIPASVMTGPTRMRIIMKRGAYATPCENIPFGEIEDYTVNIQTGVANEADLELSATANPTTIGSGTVQYQLSLSNQGPATAMGITVKHIQSGNFAFYSNVVPTAGTFNQATRTWSIGNLGPGVTVTLDFDGLIVDQTTPQSDFFEVMTANPNDPDSTPGNDNGAKTADEDDEAIIQLFPAGAPDLIVKNLNAPVSGVPGSTLDYTFTLENTGQLVAFNTAAAAYLSTDAQWSTDDQQVGTVNIGVIPPNSTVNAGGSFTIPPGFATGNFYFIVVADYQNLVFESDENNNATALPLQITGGGTGTYCASTSNFPWEDWIARVELADLVNTSGKSPYSDFTSLAAHVNAGQSYTVKLTTGYSYFTWDEYWRIWMDFNKDGDFTDPGEMVFSGIGNAPPAGTTTKMLTGNLAIPANAQTGNTRMRVSMKRGAYPIPCETLPFGEVEDYSVNIGAGTSCSITFSTGNINCQNSGTPQNPNDDTFTFEILVLGTGVSQNWQMTWNGGSTSGVFTVPKTVGPLPIAAFPGSFAFTISDNANPACSTTGSLSPPPTCSNVPVTCGFTKTYVDGTSYNGMYALETSNGYQVVGKTTFAPSSVSFIDLVTDADGQQTGAIFTNLGTAPNRQVIRMRNGNYLFAYITPQQEIRLEKQSPSQVLLWTKTYAIPNAATTLLGNVIETSSGDILVAGAVDQTTVAGIFYKFYALKTDANGTQAWLKMADVAPTQGTVVGRVFEQTQNGDFLVYIQTPDENRFVGKLDPNGNLLWKTKVAFSPLNTVTDASETSDGSIMVAYVSTTISGPSFDFVNFVKLTGAGSIAWTRSQADILGAVPNPLFIDYRSPYAAKTADGGFTVAFTGPGGLYLAGLDANGNTSWTKTYESPTVLTYLERTTDSGYLLTGSQNNKLWMMKTDNQGEICDTPPPGDYCTSASDFPWHEWIARVKVNTLDNSSGKSPYSDFTALNTELEKGTEYEMTLTTGFSYFTWDEYWKVWIDYNHDNAFQDPGELVVNRVLNAPSDGTITATVKAIFKLPASALSGPTRMRVSMKRQSNPSPCETLAFGEVEDYTVVIVDQKPDNDLDVRAAGITFEAFRVQTRVRLYSTVQFEEAVSLVEVERSVDGRYYELLETIEGDSHAGATQMIRTEDKLPNDGFNFYRLLIVLENGEMVYSLIRVVSFDLPDDFTLFPNPAQSEVFFQLADQPEEAMETVIYDPLGRPVWSRTIPPDAEFPFRIDTKELNPGLYTFFVKCPGKRAISKQFVVMY